MALQAVTGRRVAIKKMTLANQNLKLLLTEIAIMKDSHHGNIVDYIDSYIVEEKLWVVMEFMDGGCLTQILEQFDQMQMQERHIARVCLEVPFNRRIERLQPFLFAESQGSDIYS